MTRARCVTTAAAAALPLLAALLALSAGAASGQQAADSFAQEQPVELEQNFPYYMQSPVASAGKQQRATVPGVEASPASSARSSGPAAVPLAPLPPPPPPPPAAPASPPKANYQYEPAAVNLLPPPQTPGCLYDKRYFLKLDQCLERKPYPTIGLAAFRNDDLIIKKGLSDRHGCSFLLTNGLFKNYQIGKYALDSDAQCLDQVQSSELSIQFTNVSLYYLWQLRCLNYAGQLLDDATLDGKTLTADLYRDDKAGEPEQAAADSICVGSSQSFGFAALQLSNIEAQVKLAIDVYKNWRVTNVTVAMMAAGPKPADHQQAGPAEYHDPQHQYQGHAGASGIKEFTFDTIDGDELNWRYSHLYENWTRNRLHVNFLDQFRRFLWVSLQRCLGESSERLPVKLNDLFGNHKYH